MAGRVLNFQRLHEVRLGSLTLLGWVPLHCLAGSPYTVRLGPLTLSGWVPLHCLVGLTALSAPNLLYHATSLQTHICRLEVTAQQITNRTHSLTRSLWI